MAKDQTAALVMGPDTLEWAVLSRGREGFRRLDGGVWALPAEDAGAAGAGGEAALLEVLKRAFGGHHPEISLGIASDQVLLKVITVPTTDVGDIAGMVELQVDKYAPFPVETLVVSHERLCGGEQSTTVVLAAVQSAVVEALGVVLSQAGLRPSRVDVVALGWLRLLLDAGQVPGAGVMAAMIVAGEKPELLIFRDGVPLVLRSLPRLDTGTAEVVAREVAMTLMTLELQHGAGQGAALGVWGDEARAAALGAALGAVAGSAVKVASLKALPGVAEGLARRLAVADGLDLTPASWRAVDVQRAFRRRLVLWVGALLAGWALCMLAVLGLFYLQERRTLAAEAEAKALSAPAVEVRELRRRVSMVRSYVHREDSALEALREIAGLQPDGITLSTFDYRKTEFLKLAGEAREVGLVYEFKDRLDGSGLFSSSTLEGVRGSRSGHVFDMILQVRGDGQ